MRVHEDEGKSIRENVNIGDHKTTKQRVVMLTVLHLKINYTDF